MVSFTTVSEALAAYEQWLPSQPLSNHTRRTYLTQVNRYCIYLSTLHWEYGHPLQEPHARDYAVRDYKTALKVVHHAKPSSVNLGLAAVDHFYRFLELPPPQVAREDLPEQAPRALEPPEQKRFCGQWSTVHQCGIATVQMREMPTEVDQLVDLDQQLGNLDPSHLGIRLAGQLFDPFRDSASSGVMRTLFLSMRTSGRALSMSSCPTRVSCSCSKVFRSVKHELLHLMRKIVYTFAEVQCSVFVVG